MAEGVEDGPQVESQPPQVNGNDTAPKPEAQDDSKVNGTPTVKEEEDTHDTPNDDRPAKRQKLDVGSQLRGTSRAVSPPWKKVAADGPTSFLDSGKRRSARTNIVPLELQPPSSKRRTRAANHQSVREIRSRYSKGGEAMVKSSPIPAKATPKRSYNLLSTERSKPSSAGAMRPTKPTRALRNTPAAAPVKPFEKNSVKTPSKTPTKSTRIPVSQRWAMEISPVKAEFDSPPLTPTDGKPRLRAARRQASLIQDAKPVKRKPATNHENKPERAARTETPEEDEGSDSLDELSSSLFDDEDFELDPNITPQRLNLKVKLPELIPQHPLNIPRKSHHPTFREWVEQADPFEGGDPRLSDDQVRREARSRMRVLQASEPGGILSGISSLDVPENEEEPPRQYFHHDHLLAHALDMQRRMEREKAKHMRWAKKISQAVIDYWKELQPKTDEDLQRDKEDLMEITALAIRRQCVTDLAIKWDMLRAELVKQRHIKWEQEQEVLEKERLNKVLEQSTQLLDARKRRDSDVESTDGGSRTDATSEGDNSSVESDAESNMSINSSEHEDESEGEANDDQDLSPEELRRKYQDSMREAPEGIAEGTPATEMTEPLASTTKEESISHAASEFGHDQMPAPERNERPPEDTALAAMLDDDNNSLLDETDESVDMDDDMGDTESESDDDDDNDASSSEAGSDGRSGLLGLFSKKELADAAAPEDESQGRANLDREPSQAPESLEKDTNDASGGHVIPDASQVQTPSASNSDVPSMGLVKTTENLQSRSNANSNDTSGQEKRLALEAPQNNSAENMEVDHDSLPATPVSSKPLRTAVPSLLRGTLREYQHYGLDWLAGLYANGTNGILADEMGLGKTIQTIVLLAHLAVEHEVWGPHLIVVPTSVMLNWEMEFKKFLPGFKVMTYYGTQEERKQKRKGWLDDDKWNVVISSYQLVLQDQISFKKRGWHYLVLDEAHNIKNFRSQRWQTLLTFRTAARLLLTGTPLQNNLTELWSLMFFLMPSDSTESGIAGFADLQSFTNWFKKPVDQILEQGRDTMDAEAQELVRRLHEVLRPYLLRRLKADVEKQMPAKYEHVVYCKLSKRQRYLYDGFMSRASTRETLAGGNYLSIINCLMQLRKVCNHPDLFETRPIVTSFAMSRSAVADFEIKELFLRRKLLQDEDDRRVNLDVVDLLPGSNGPVSALDTIQPARLGGIAKLRQIVTRHSGRINKEVKYDGSSVDGTLSWMENDQRISARDDLHHRVYLTSLRSQRRPLISHSLVNKLRFDLRPASVRPRPERRTEQLQWLEDTSQVMDDLVVDLPRRFDTLQTTIEKYSFVTPAVVAHEMPTFALTHAGKANVRQAVESFPQDHFHESRMRLSIAFPDKRLLQYDCGKLQRLDALLRKLQAGGHRALIFTQMTKVLDILEQFLNIHGHRYLRLDGSTKIEQRQILTDRFNNDPKILAFILSSRSGGLGINLTGADTVIFYDLDWNPAMDKQCQDRCHRIGQTRDVHIYRFVSEYTIEANILRKANQKRLLDDVIIQEGEFTTDYFHRPNPRDAYTDDAMHEADAEASAAMDRILGAGSGNDKLSTRILEQAEDKEDAQAAKVAEKEVEHADDADFSERPGPLSNKVASGTHTPAVKDAATPKPMSSLDFDAPEYLRGSIQPRTEMALDVFAEKRPIGVDVHMVEHLEWELRDIPIGPPPGYEKAKKKGKDHKVVRKR